MDEYVDIYYNKTMKTQRFVISEANMCSAKIKEELDKRHISYTHNKFLGKYEPLTDFVSQTYKYAKKWRWLPTVHLTSFDLKK